MKITRYALLAAGTALGLTMFSQALAHKEKHTGAQLKAFEDVFREAAAKATDDIATAEQKLVDDFATKYKKTVVKSDRAAIGAKFKAFHTGPDATWDKALYDRVQAIK